MKSGETLTAAQLAAMFAIGRPLKVATTDHDDRVFGRNPKPAKSSKVARNAPCPCGSGTKAKRCCGGVA